MLSLLLQVQMLLAALAAFLPLVPDKHRARAAEILELAANALAASGAVASNVDDLAVKLASVRAEIDTLVKSGASVSAEQLDAAMARVRSASTAFRTALAQAEGAA